MSLNNLPVEWMNVKISDVTVKGEQRKPNDSEEFIYVDIGSINRDLKKIEKPQFLLGKDAPSRARKVIKKGDVLVSLTRPNLNAVALVGDKYDQQIASTGFEVISPLIVENRYLFSLVRTQHFINEISKQEQGALYPAAKSSDVQAYEFPLPSLAEQQEIVRQLDVMLSQVEQIKARLDAIPVILKKFRQSVLADAVSGKLTEGWRQKNAHLIDVEKDYRDLIIGEKSIVNEKKSDLKKIKEEKFKLRSNLIDFEKYGFSCPIGWKILPFFELALLNRGFDLPNSVRTEGEYPILSAGGLIGFHNEYKVEGICVTVGRSGSVGRVFISEKNSWPLNTTLYVKDFGFSNPKYVYWSLKSMDLAKFSSSTAVPSLNRNEFMFEPVAIPPIKEQLEIVKKVEQFIKYSKNIENLVQSAQKRVNLLTQSILAKAFSGELTAEWRTQHQELITGVNCAESLLAKIQVEREASKPVKKAKKVKAV